MMLYAYGRAKYAHRINVLGLFSLMFRPSLLLLLAALATVGCVKQVPLEETATLRVIRDTSLPAPGRADLVAANRPSFIGPLDTLGVEVFGVPELTREVPVDASGMISIPLVGAIDANGKTAAELSSQIAASLRGRYVRDPQVTVVIRSSVSQVVTVDGSVSKPGQYPVTNQTTLMRAIAISGGLEEFAKLEDVVIIRQVNNQKMAGLYNLAQIRRGSYEDPPIYPNDIVIVGDSPARRMFRNFVQVAPLAIAPLVAILQ